MSTLRGAVNLMATVPALRVAEVAAHAERAGFSRVWLADEGIVTRDVFVSLTAVAAATTSVGIGPGITSPFTRHPGMTACAVASLDEVSGGRAFLGLGAGGVLSLNPLAIKRRRPVRAVEEMVAALRGLWRGDTVNIEGDTLVLRDARLDGARPDIEIHIAGRGPRMVDLAGRVADGFYLSYLHKGVLGDRVNGLRAHGRPLTLTYCTRVVLDDAGWEAARRDMTFRLPDSPADIHELIGFGPRDEASLRAALADGGPAAAAPLVRDEWVEPFVIAGTAADCRSELHRLTAEHGLDEFLIMVDDVDAGEELIDTIAPIIGLSPSDAAI